MKMTTKREVKCTGCIHHDKPMDGSECIAPIPAYIPYEQGDRYMKLWHEKMIRCEWHMSPERLRREILELGK